MSRVAKKLISIKGVETKEENGFFIVKGPKGENKVKLHPEIKLEIENDEIKIAGEANMALKGTFNRLISNAVEGVLKRFEKTININGVGYKVSQEKNRLKFVLGFSHDKFVDLVEDVETEIKGLTTLFLRSCDKQALGDFADKICRLRKYDVYKGKGLLDSSKYYPIKKKK